MPAVDPEDSTNEKVTVRRGTSNGQEALSKEEQK
jgi:hypothetical protein